MEAFNTGTLAGAGALDGVQHSDEVLEGEEAEPLVLPAADPAQPDSLPVAPVMSLLVDRQSHAIVSAIAAATRCMRVRVVRYTTAGLMRYATNAAIASKSGSART